MKKIINKKYYILSFIIPMIIYLIFLSTKGIIQNVNNFFSYDLRAQHLPIFNYLKNILLGKSSIYYSYYAGMGTPMLTTLVYYVISPINILLIIIKDIRWAILIIYLTKASLSGLTMFIYLKNKFKKESFTTVIFSTCYALSSYLINYFFCIFWFDAIYLAPIVLLSIDKIIDKERMNLLYIFSLALAIICNIQIGYGLCIFSLIYYLYSFNIKYDIKKDFKKFIKLSKIFIISSLCAGAISSGVILALISSYKNTNIARTNAGYDLQTSSIDYIIKNIFSIGTVKVNHNNDYEPFIYCGLIITLLSILYLFDKSIDKKRRKSALIIILFFIISFCIKSLNIFWHITEPLHLNYRYSFYLSLFLILITYEYYTNKDKFTKREIIILIISILIGLLFANIYKEDIHLIHSIIFLILNGILIILVKNKSPKFELILFLIVLTELTVNAHLSIFAKDNSTGNRYNPFDNIYKINENNHPSQSYRILYDDTYINDSLILNRNSTLSYFYSTINGNTTKFLNRNFSESGFNYYLVSIYDSPLLLSLLGTKYLYQPDDVDSGLYKKIGAYKTEDYDNKKKNIYLYENPYSLSLGYLINKDAKYPKNGNLVDYQNEIIKSFTGINKDVMKNISYNKKENDEFCKTVKDYYCETYEVDNNTNNNYIYIHAMVPQAYTTSNPQIKVYKSADHPFLIKSEDKHFEISIHYLEENYASRLDFTTYDKANLIESLKKLQENMLTNIKIDNNIMKAKLDSSKDGILFLSIPYDKNFKIYVDGKKKKYYPVLDNTFIGLDIKKGKHNIKLINTDKKIKWYILSSLISIIITIIIYKYQKNNIEDN